MSWFRGSILWLMAWSLVVGAGAEEPAPESPAGVSVYASASILRRHKPGTWSVLAVTAANTRDADGEAMLSAYFAPETGHQYARRMWVPAHARRTTWLPIQVPANVVKDSLKLTTLSLEVSGGREVLLHRPGDLMTSDVLLGIDRDPGKMGMYFRKPMLDENHVAPNLDADAFDTALAARLSSHLPSNMTDLTQDFLPPWPEVLQGFDQFVLTSDRITHDAAGLVALRSWVRDGGRLWIMLDRVRPETVAAIVGNAVNLEVVDRVELDQYALETAATFGQPAESDACEFEVPVDLVRVVTSSADVPCRINGWPAAIWLPYGEGEVLLTTLGPRGWRAETGDAPTAPTSALRSVAARFFASREGRLDVKGFQPALQQQIGYHIPSRSFAVTVLGGYCVALLGVGLVLAKRGRLDWLAWLVPCVTVATTAILFGVGSANATSVQPTIAFAQLLRFGPQTNEARVDGLAAIYDQQSRAIDLHGEQRNWLVPDPSPDSEVRRQIWTDNDGTQSQNASTRAGSVGLASISATRVLSQHVAVQATFGPDGLAGKLSAGELQGVADPVIVSPPAPSLAVTIARDGSFVARPEQVLAADQYSAEALLSDEQRRRQDTCRWLLNPADSFEFPRQPNLLFWCRPLAAGVSLPDGFDVAGSALAMMPLDLRRTPAKSPFQIPATFLRVDVVQSKHGASIAYQRKSGEWVKGLTTPTETVLRFQLPEQVLPCRLQRGTFTIRINAPSRELTVRAYQGDEPLLVRSVRNPNGVIDFEFSSEQLLQDALGGVMIGVSVGETDLQKSKRLHDEQRMKSPPTSFKDLSPEPEFFENSTWQIDYVRLTVSGQTN